MLDFLYTQTYDLSATSPPLDDIIALYALGDKYAISSLCQHASHDFEKTIRNFRSPYPHSSYDILLSCIPELYGSTPDSDHTLKVLLVEEIIDRHCSSYTARPDVEALLVSSSWSSFTPIPLHFGDPWQDRHARPRLVSFEVSDVLPSHGIRYTRSLRVLPRPPMLQA